MKVNNDGVLVVVSCVCVFDGVWCDVWLCEHYHEFGVGDIMCCIVWLCCLTYYVECKKMTRCVLWLVVVVLCLCCVSN